MKLIFSILYALALIIQTKSCTANKAVPIIIDADTANEIDDLYAIVRALVAPELDVRGITSAQYHRSPLAPDRSVDQSQRLNEEIARLMSVKNVPVVLGSNDPLIDDKTPQESEAARFIIRVANKMKDGERLHLVILGPCTNVASALLMEPSIVNKIEVSYIGFWHDQEKKTWSRLEFNSGNDQKAVDVLLNNDELIFNSMTATTSGELKFDKENARKHLSGKGGIKDYLYDRWLHHNRWWQKDDSEKKKWTMWDVAIIEALINPDNATIEQLAGPKTDQARTINVYTEIDVPAIKSSFWTSIDAIPDGQVKRQVFTNASILTMKNEQILENHDLYISNGKITGIYPTGQQPVHPDAQIIDASGKWLIPGLSEMHAHIPVGNTPEAEEHVKETMMLYLANGVTVIRGMLGDPYHLEFRKKVNSGEIIAPRIYTSSPSFNGNSVQTVEEAQEKVTEAKNDGYDFLKIHPGIKSEVMEALVERAKEEHIRYSGHVPFDVGIQKALEYKYASVDHVDGYIRGIVADDVTITSNDVGFFGSNLVDQVDQSKIDELAQKTRENDVWVVPTQSLFTRWAAPIPAVEMMQSKEYDYLPADTRYTWRTGKDRMLSSLEYSSDHYEKFLKLRQKIIRSLYDHDVDFLLGSDSPQVMNVPGFSIHHEIASLIGCGLPSSAILESGTSAPARFFGDVGIFGTVELGADANLILVGKNPLDDLTTLKKPLGTMIHGQWLDRAYFDEELKKLALKHSE